MFKRFMLGLTFLAALGLVGVATPDTSEARRYGRQPYVARYYGPPREYYRAPQFPRRYYYRGPTRYYGYPGYYDYPGYYGGRGGVYFSFGF